MKKLAVVGICSAILYGCGGGGGDEPAAPVTSAPPPAEASVEGFWSGTSSTGYDVSLAVLENGETWGVYSYGGSIYGALYGQTTVSGSSLSGAGSDFNIPSRSVASATYAGTFVEKSSIEVTTSGGAGFTGVYEPAYDQPASLQAVAGTYAGSGVSGDSPVQAVSVTVTATGQVTVPSSLGCSASGSIAPRPTGKNIFNVTVTFLGSTCALGNGATTQGVAYYDSATGQILVMAMNSSKTDGFIYIGAK